MGDAGFGAAPVAGTALPGAASTGDATPRDATEATLPRDFHGVAYVGRSRDGYIFRQRLRLPASDLGNGVRVLGGRAEQRAVGTPGPEAARFLMNVLTAGHELRCLPADDPMRRSELAAFVRDCAARVGEIGADAPAALVDVAASKLPTVAASIEARGRGRFDAATVRRFKAPTPDDDGGRFLRVPSSAEYRSAVRVVGDGRAFGVRGRYGFPAVPRTTGQAGQFALGPYAADGEDVCLVDREGEWIDEDDEKGLVGRLRRAAAAAVAALGPLDRDVLDAVFALMLRDADKRRWGGVEISVDDVCGLLGMTKRLAGNGWRGGYEKADRDKVAAALARLSKVWMWATMPDYRKPQRDDKGKLTGKYETVTLASRLFAVTGAEWLGRLEDGDERLMRATIAPGAVIAHTLDAGNAQVMLMSRRVLEYHRAGQLPEKGLLRWLSADWRINAHKGARVRAKAVLVGTLLDAAELAVDPDRPSRALDRLEAALDTLARDGEIGGWRYVPGREARRPGGRGLAEGWERDALVEVSMPAFLAGKKAAMIERAREGRGRIVGGIRRMTGTGGPELGIAMREARKAAGLTQPQAAERAGVAGRTWERAERGERVRAGNAEAIMAWLDGESGGRPASPARRGVVARPRQGPGLPLRRVH
ncbi:hypothetical protein STAQ_33740 [Allostella sp. ATCC 35155]|nr:hypothetical protein STAQ_33740 [Stella sp. ATCC 35155]